MFSSLVFVCLRNHLVAVSCKQKFRKGSENKLEVNFMSSSDFKHVLE